ncbi:MAG: hypothetical protein H8E73_03870 [Planctomycetes bacterium]|nr:hypothetical protein [Planctomycetota bacterium]MBL7189041.1 hypothetical protein [Phycisphaerae bacterium]
MDESINAEKKKRQKPPLTRRRIAAEILGGVAVGFAAGLLGGFVFLMMPYDRGCFNGVLALAAAIVSVFPMVYGVASGVGVYLVGKRGEQTGSFLWTLGCGFAGWFVIIGMRRLVHSFYWSYWLPSIPDWAFVPLVLLTPPLLATIAFNLTRRYKEPPSS